MGLVMVKALETGMATASVTGSGSGWVTGSGWVSAAV